ncbi:hypothetical protein EV666_10587 [Camelimonas lactis]|uniref:Uncharacterized protein n=1 Tax=Camelimonas lactis TaxID=659006 RepID=A0A4R2GTU6_9HYPH|nr:hypothetical protein EV666_10587 [Camelimonas lactis]
MPATQGAQRLADYGMNACLVNGYRKTVVQIGNIRGALVT